MSDTVPSTHEHAAKGSNAHKYTVIAGLSVAHEVPAALGTLMVITYFRDRFNMPLEMVGIFGLPLIISGLKWIWAPMVDRIGSNRFGRRLSWIVPSAVMVALLYIVMGLIQPSLERIYLIVGLFMVIKIFFSLYEIAADAYVIENLRDEEKGAGSGAYWFGKEVGQVIGLAVLLYIADVYGWMACFFSAAGLFMLTNLIALTRKEQPVRPRPENHEAKLWTYVKEPVNRRVLLLVFVFAFAVQIPSAIIGPFLNDKGFSLAEIGVTVGVAAGIGAALSLAIASFTIRRVGVKRMAIIVAIFGLLALPPFLWLTQTDSPTLLVVLGIIFWGSLMTAPIRMTFYAARLQWTGRDQAGTDLTLQQCAWFFGYAATLAFSGFVAGMFGWMAVFIMNGVLVTVVMIAFILLHDRLCAETASLHD
ncbi:MAG: MFS transporter, partial [Pseudomonadota bacterium]